MAAFNNVPEARRPPPCPEELTEIAYAGFLYDPRCNVRGFLPISPHMTDIRVELRRVACPNVLDGSCETLHELYQESVFPPQ